ncbi:glycosyltransferase [Rubellicoccus peritrichatus]|uniref:Glycosyltransferase n=1 Tax=Rubellicoccus peritrichatus TaxID=3080537 RepID=A0AAQ3L969_9BACT|nr:glycosyltransferase [Puniceicoccus sp. CR14]WOO40962.1 glycosyltransferase [Puniceicoccus sp. CR14]
MSEFCLYPVVSSQETANDLIARAVWAFTGTSLERLVILRQGDWSLDAFQQPDNLDPSIDSLFEQFRARIEVLDTSPETLPKICDTFLLWDEAPEHQAFLKAQAAGVRVWRVDKLATRMEGSFWIEANLSLLNDRDAIIAQSKEKLQQCSDELRHFDRATIFASGPSVAAYRDFSYEDSLSIVCNSVVMDGAMLDYVNARILCFADPLFHFGPSLYSHVFRQRMRKVVEERSMWVFIPIKYYQTLIAHVPEIADRVIALPFAKRKDFNLDIVKDPELKVTANILTYLLLPIASTFARRVELIGCDGRPLAENQYFWSFNRSTQINDQMDNIKEVHPSFFKIDYNDYYTDHCETLETLVHSAEASGHEVVSLTPSHIPVLQRRSPPPGQSALEQLIHESSANSILLSLNPDLKGRFGHYLHFDRKLRNAAQQCDVDLLTLASRDVDLKAEDADWPVIPFFSLPIFHSNKSNNHNKPYREWATGFCREIEILIDVLKRSDKKKTIRVFLYMSTPRAVGEFINALSNVDLPHVEWIFNLTSIYPKTYPMEAALKDARIGLMRYLVTMAPSLERLYRIRLITDTDELRKLLGFSSEKLPVLPMFGITELETDAVNASEVKKPRVLYPSNAQSLKGYSLLPEVARKVEERIPGACQIILRTHAPIGREQDEMAELTQSIPKSVTQIDGVLDEKDYRELLTSTNVLLLPYRAEAFYARTSGQLVDALTLGIPMVATRETWSGRIVEMTGYGETFSDGSVEEMADAVVKVVQNLESYRNGCRKAAEEWLAENTPEKVISLLLEELSDYEGVEKRSEKLALANEIKVRMDASPKQGSARFLEIAIARFRGWMQSISEK